jgi:hypothetical protein
MLSSYIYMQYTSNFFTSQWLSSPSPSSCWSYPTIVLLLHSCPIFFVILLHFLKIYFFFCSTQGWTQVLALARQLLYHLGHSASPLLHILMSFLLQILVWLKCEFSKLSLLVGKNQNLKKCIFKMSHSHAFLPLCSHPLLKVDIFINLCFILYILFPLVFLHSAFYALNFFLLRNIFTFTF